MTSKEEKLVQQLQEEIQFKETLLSISEAVASIKGREALLKVVFEKINPIFNFYDVGLFVIDKNGSASDLAAINPNISPSEVNHKLFTQGINTFEYKKSAIEWVVNIVEKNKQPYILHYNEELYDMWPDYYQTDIMKEVGYAESMITTLSVGGDLIGAFFVNSLQKNNFQITQFPLFQAIADQLAVAVSNVLANEQLLEEKQFKETLLDISEAVASTQTGSQLLKVILDHIQPIFNFYDIGLFVFDNQNNHLNDWVIKYPILSDSKGSQQMFDNPTKYSQIEINTDGLVSELITKLTNDGSPLIANLSELADRYPDFVQNDIIKEEGYQDTMIALLRYSGKILGLFCLNLCEKKNYRKEQFPLFQAIADQLAVAVSNVNANEQLLEEKRFKETLLGISEAVASIQDREELFRVIFERIRPLVKFDDFGLFHLDASGRYHRDLAVTDEHSIYNTGVKASKINEYLPHDDSVKVFMNEGPMTISLGELTKRFPGHPFFPFMQEAGLKQIFGGPLVYQGKKIGMLAFNSKQENFYSEKDFPLFQAIADQLAVAVSNVLANEQLVEEKQKTEDLLAITESIANITTGPELIKAIFDKLQKVFPFDDAGLFHLDYENNRERDLTVDYGYEISGINAAHVHEGLTGWMPLSQASKLVVQQGVLVKGKEIYEELEHPHFKNPKNRIFEQIIAAPLQHGDQTIGLLCFWGKQPNTFDNQLPLFKAITDQMSIALNNIIANEQLIEEKRKTEDLLAITESIANITTGPELVLAIFDKLQKVLPFDDAGLFHLDWENEKECDLIVDYEYYSSETSKTINSSGIRGWLPMTELSKRMAEKTVILSTETLYKKHQHPHFQYTKKVPFQQIIAGPLKQGERTIGLFYFWSKTPQAFDEKLVFFNTVADQLSVALSNVLANEQLVEEKQKTEDLLAITESIANITTGPELVCAIFDKLHKVLQFDEAGLFHLDWENEKERDLIIDYGYFVSETGKSINQSGITGWLPMTELSKSIARKTVLLSTEKLYQKYRHPHFKYTKKVPFQQIIAGPLKQGKQAIGLFYFWSKVPNAFDDKLTLFNAMSDQLSVALSNILANEAIQLDNKHKKVSLDIAKSIGTINKIDVLLKETVKTLVPIFKSQEHALIIIDEEQDEYVDLAVLHEEIAGNDLDLKLSEKGFYSGLKIPYKGSQLEEVVVSIEQNNDIPVLFDYNKDYSQYEDKKLLEELRKKLDTCAIALLKVSGKIIGVFILAYTEGNEFDISQIELFKSLSDQLALAVSNVLAAEDIQRREQEKSLQISIVNTLNSNIAWKDKLLQLTQSFSNYLDNHVVIFAFQPERSTEFCHTFEKVGANEYRHFDYQNFLDFIELEEEEYRNNNEKTNGSLLQTGTAFVKHQQKNTVLQKVAKKFNVNSRLTTSFKLTFPGHYRLSFLSKDDLGYTEKDKQLLEVIRPSLELALEKVFALERITELNAQLRQEKNYLREEIKLDHDFENIIGQHISLKNAFEQVRQLAPMDISVLITGETGTGKELIARALHETSVRSEKTLIKMNCAAMPSELIESELFGHEKGAFTGATKQRIGKFELAHESTIFLDEVGELSLEAQAKLLRVLQEKEFERLGGSKTLTSDFRVVAATNRNLQEAIDEGTFRSDLFYRLNGFQIYLPPLRDRLEDAPLLARHFAKTFAYKIGKPFTGFTPQSLLQIQEYSWPGNVRELKNRVEQALVTAKTDIVTLQFSDESPLQHPVISAKGMVREGLTIDYIEERKNMLEKELLTQVLEQTNWRVSGQKGAAKLLRLKATTLEYRMKKLHISKPS